MIGERKSPYTVKEYTFLGRIFVEFLGKPLKSCNAEDIERFKNYLATERKYSKSSQYLAMKAVKHMFRVLDISEPKNLFPPKRPRKMPNYLTENETSMLLDSVRDDGITHLILSLLANTGVRVGELCKLRVEDVDPDEQVIRVRSGKGDRDRIVIIPDTTRKLLETYLPVRNSIDVKSDTLLISRKKTRFDPSSIERIVKTAARKAGIRKKVTPHVLRHTFATAVLRNGGDIRFIQQLLGHASLNTTQIYTHVDDNTLKEMYTKHRPRY